MLLRATIISIDGAQSVRVRDLTDTGAGVLCDTPLASGTDVIFRRGDLLVAARVVWTEGKEAGLEFYRPLPFEGLTANMKRPTREASKGIFFQS